MKRKILILLALVGIPLISILSFFLLLSLLWLPDRINDVRFKNDYIGVLDDTIHFKMSGDKLRKIKGTPNQVFVDDSKYLNIKEYQEKIFNIESKVIYEAHSSFSSALYSVTYIIPIKPTEKDIFDKIYKNIINIYNDTYEVISYTDEIEANQTGFAMIKAKSKIDKSEITVNIKLENEVLTIVARNDFDWKP